MQYELTKKQAYNLKRRNEFKKNYSGYLFLAPFLILFFIFTLLPIVFSFILSFFNYNGLETPIFNGIDNYKFLFLKDSAFPLALKNTIVFAVFIGPIGYILSFLMAVFLNNLRYKSALALAFYSPSITSSIAITVIWMYFFSNDQYGLFNNFLLKLGLVDTPILFNQDPQYIFPIIILISVWMSMGTGFLVFLAGLQSMDKEIFEQGKIDGIKNSFQELIYITIPQMKPQLLFGAITTIVASFGVFDIVQQFAGFPTPNNSADTLVLHAYDYAFIRFQFGYSATISAILFTITFVLGKIFTRVFSEKN